MESEKVKEIKKALEDLDMICYEKTCSDRINKISKYINELESENETLKDSYRVKAYDCLRKENKQLKCRIDELKKENAEILERGDYQKGYDDAVKMMKDTAYDCVKETELKQFAEWLSKRSNNQIYLKLVEEFLSKETGE